MLSQEDIYKLLFEEQWEILLEILHQQKKIIASDSLLSAAAMAIEREFFRKLKSYANDREDIVIALETFSQLDAGNFYKLKQENSDVILEELKTRKPDQYVRPKVTAESLHHDRYNA
ncbi:MAG TPA: hypothetical protein VKB19_09695, partial [Pedobacter sp.]|nr:hypothetical protein [Pedobacter sp.]